MVQVALVRLRAKLPRPASDAKRRWLDREAIALAVSDGTSVGRAEASPLPQMSLETLEHAKRAEGTCSGTRRAARVSGSSASTSSCVHGIA